MGVVGIGGLFFRARDPNKLRLWYCEHLGVGAGCSSVEGQRDEWSWMTQAGPVVFAPFADDSDYFPTDKAFMLNLRVRDLPQLLDNLREEGVEVITKPEWDDPSIGRFARIHDPEGNPIELWEPPAKSAE